MKIVIPMAGMGFRFVNAGYQTPKPLIEIEGKPMIEHIINMFPGETDFVFICNSEHLAQTPMQEVLERVAPFCKIVEVASHKLGPVYSVLQAKDFINDQEPVIVSYCDCAVFWDYEEFKQEMQDSQCQACSVRFKGFHPPHSTIPEVRYAYMKEDNGNLVEIREKIPFTQDKNQEYASSGMHYFSTGKCLKDYCQKLIDKELHHNGEYYISLVNNLLVNDGLKVRIHEASNLLSWGAPQELEEYKYWSDFFLKEFFWKPKVLSVEQVLIPMAGEGSRFKKEGYKDPKPLIMVGDKPMVTASVSTFPKANKYIFVARKEHIEEQDLKALIDKDLDIDSKVICLKEATSGGASTCLFAEDFLDKEKSLFVSACDCGLVFNEKKFLQMINSDIDCLVWTFRNYPGANARPEMYSWVREENGLVKKILLKQTVSETPEKDPCIVGAFWFKKAGDLISSAKEFTSNPKPTAGEFHLEGCIDYLIKQGKKVVIFDIDRFVCWGTPNDLKTWEYWKSYFQKKNLIKEA